MRISFFKKANFSQANLHSDRQISDKFLGHFGLQQPFANRPDLLVARARFRGSMRARSLCPPGRHAGGAVASEVTSAPIAPVPTSPVPNLHAIVEKCREDKKRVGVGYARGMRVTLRRRRPGAMRRCRSGRRQSRANTRLFMPLVPASADVSLGLRGHARQGGASRRFTPLL